MLEKELSSQEQYGSDAELEEFKKAILELRLDEQFLHIDRQDSSQMNVLAEEIQARLDDLRAKNELTPELVALRQQIQLHPGAERNDPEIKRSLVELMYVVLANAGRKKDEETVMTMVQDAGTRYTGPVGRVVRYVATKAA